MLKTLNVQYHGLTSSLNFNTVCKIAHGFARSASLILILMIFYKRRRKVVSVVGGQVMSTTPALLRPYCGCALGLLYKLKQLLSSSLSYSVTSQETGHPRDSFLYFSYSSPSFPLYFSCISPIFLLYLSCIPPLSLLYYSCIKQT